ncbi:Casein kinase I [Durusdinium trenchii]|uniref:Casein kinase I n=1 Tax=Durusdinium trenchii TaxID=1381693 RepID=A0ABP0Q6L0_9DINO
MGGVHSMVDCASEEDCKGKQLQPKGLGVLEQLFDADACGLYKRCAEASFGERKKAILQTRLDGLLQDLFSAHDLNKNGLLEELELIQLNKKIVLLHQGRNADMDAVKEKYQDLFRRKLDAAGKAVPFSVFKAYMLQVLADVDPDPCAQEMMLEQWIVEAQAARVMFHMPSVTSVTDLPFLSTISFDKDDLPASRTSIETTSTTASMQPPKNVRCESFVHVGPIDDNIRPCC